jgi:hypothetical protein
MYVIAHKYKYKDNVNKNNKIKIVTEQYNNH